MINRLLTISIFSIVLAFCGLLTQPVMATELNFYNASQSFTSNESINAVGQLNYVIKRGQPYDESKDPALRTGTENWEQDQSSFFAIPALILGIIAVVIIFTRNKN